MLMNYYRHIDRNQVQFDFLCNKTKPGAYDDEVQRLGGRIYHTPGLNPAKYPLYLKYLPSIQSIRLLRHIMVHLGFMLCMQQK